ncbi:MAG: sel1 repeat family protein [Alphaproteobacteria bacterium]|nr:sel1 repeat family protein [Alphaproteobacteria bacterium]
MKKKHSAVSGFALTASLLLAVIAAPASASPRFKSPEEALRQGISAFNGGYHEIAIPALEFAAAENLFLATYYLAIVYADSNSAYTDHGKAYMLFKRIANEHTDVDPDHDRRAPYVARSLTALAKYVRDGLPALRISANPRLAVEYLNHAAVYFNDEDAQFELSKMQINGDGVAPDVARGRHWLAVLAENGHAGAQAFLADLYWRGKFVSKDSVRALTLISVAVKNAPVADQVWIDDIYQNIYCGAPQGVREQATGMVAEWDVRYGRKPQLPGRLGLGGFDIAVNRTCADGRPVPMRSGELPLDVEPAGEGVTAAVEHGPADVIERKAAPGFIYGGASMHPVGERR